MNKYEISKNKIITPEKLEQLLAVWHFKAYKIVFSNGCFDILHRGHVEYLAKASSLGDKMILGLNSDSSIKRIKGPDRPVQDQLSRSIILASLQFIDAVVLFDEDTPYNLINKIKPDILVKGADYKAEDVVGYDIVTANGGRVETIELVKGYSTTGIIQRLSH